MKYKKGYKYQLYETEVFKNVGIYPEKDIVPGENADNPFIDLTKGGKLTVIKGYAWDGCSGPTIDRKSNMRAGLGHDALAQLFRLKLIDARLFFALNDFFAKTLLEDGMWSLWAKVYKTGVSINDFYTDPANAKKIYKAP